MNEIKQATNDIFSLTLSALFAFIIAPTAYVGYLYFNYIKMAIVGLGVMGIGLAGLAIGSVAIGLIGGLVYRGADAWLKIQAKRVELDLANADVAYRKAESVALLQQVTAIKPGHHAVITHANHPLQVVSYAVPQLALPDKVATVAQLSTPSVESDLMGSIVRGDNWIKNFLFDASGRLRVHHVKTDGPTGVGKTFLMLQCIHYLQYPYPSAEYWLCDPKFEGEKSGWPFAPFVTDFDLVAEGAEYLYQNVVLKRKHDNVAGIEPKHPAFLLFDETDGCFDEHGDKYIKPVRRSIKEGRSGWVHVFVSGQSPLAGDTGFGGSVLRNMTRFVMGNEAVAFTNNPQFSFWPKEYRRDAVAQLKYLQERNERAVLVIPQSNQGMPFVAVVPEMTMPNFNQAAPVSEASKLILSLPPVTGHVMDLSSIPAMVDEKLNEMIAAYNSGKTITEVAAIGYSSAGDKQNVSCLVKLQANGVQLRSEHLAKLAKVRG